MGHELRQDEIERRERALRPPKETALSGAFRDRLAGANASRRQATHRIDQPGPESGEVGLVGTALRDACGDDAAGGATLEDRAEPVQKAAVAVDSDMGQVAKGLRRLASESPEFNWLAKLAERHAAMTGNL